MAEIDASIVAEMTRQIDRMIKDMVCGGYPPGYDLRTGMPGTLKPRGRSGCPHGCVVVCIHYCAMP
jgi:hypothetical protein